ncbi:hypothetical protein [Actinophytocola sp.]|uniref:hypothetical protein n=1 Tax=Actinophytocola sp. TaxID=1872138 RepID=UPI003D6C35C6
MDAQEHDEDTWSVTTAELARVLIGLHVFPNLWSEVCGEGGAVRFADLPSTDLWSFFGLHEIARDGDEVRVSPGNFSEDVALRFTLGDRDRIQRAELSLRETWALGGEFGINPFGLDIARGFAGALVPEPDRRSAADVLLGLDLDHVGVRYRDPEFQSTTAGQLLLAYTGGIPDTNLVFSTSALNIEHRDDWLQLRINTF